MRPLHHILSSCSHIALVLEPSKRFLDHSFIFRFHFFFVYAARVTVYIYPLKIDWLSFVKQGDSPVCSFVVAARINVSGAKLGLIPLQLFVSCFLFWVVWWLPDRSALLLWEVCNGVWFLWLCSCCNLEMAL